MPEWIQNGYLRVITALLDLLKLASQDLIKSNIFISQAIPPPPQAHPQPDF